MKLSSEHFFLTVVLLTGVASAQVATGNPPFGSFGGGPFDTVNLGNLNVHFAIPVLHKAGRGMPFTYDMSYDSSIWTPGSSNGVIQWQPAGSWGWRGTTEVSTGYISESITTVVCSTEIINPHLPPVANGWMTTIANVVYHDAWGVAHPFAGDYWFLIPSNPPTCSGNTSGGTIGPVATDGSGYQYQSWGVYNRNGKQLAAPVNGTSGSATNTDSNGNQITVNSSGQFFDTLSSTTPVLSVSTAAPPTATTFTYTPPSGGSASYTMNYQQYTVATAFGVSGVSEYGPLSNPLVSNIQLPDGSSYAFTYEKTPGSCTPLSGTYSANCVTGRIASVTLPTGGTITYAYTGGTNGTGIYSDGSTAGLNRTLNPGGEWQYSRTLVSGSPGTGSTWTTTVIDPNSNYTVINSAEDASTTLATHNFYETQRQAYQGSVSPSNLLATSIRCYNAIYTGCSTAKVSSPITQTDVYSQLPNAQTRLSELIYNTYGSVTDDKEYGYGVALNAAPSSTYLVRETGIIYYAPSNGIASMRETTTVTDWSSHSAVTLSSSSYTFDGAAVTATSGTPQHISVTGARGNLTQVTTSTSSRASLSKSWTSYDTGNPYVATDVNGAQTTYVYSSAANPYNSSLTASCGNSFATTINEPLSLSRSIQWNCVGGIAQQMTNENGQIVKSDYTDSDFWRPADIYDQENNETKITYGGQTAVEVTLQNFNGGNSVSDSRATVDGFGRPIFNQRLQGPSATNYDTTEVDYNILGQPYRSTMLYSATASPSSDNTTAPAKTTAYDALGRVLTVTDADGGKVSFTYTNNDVLQQVSGTQSQTFQKQLEYDGLGRLASVCEISSTLPGVGTCGQATTQTGYWTKYTYDALGHLLTVTQNAQATSGSQQTRAFTYDWLGRMTSESNPETGNNGANGTVTYTYDAISPCGDGTNYSYPGDLVQKKDNAGNFTCSSYDALHRVLKQGNGSVANTILREFVYDAESSYPTGVSVSNGKTHMVEAKTINTSSLSVNVTDEFFSYSPRGEATDVYELTPHSGSGVYYHTTASYWPTGALETLSGIPGVPTIYYGASNGAGLDGEGRVTQVTAASGTNPVTSVAYSTTSTTNPLGALTGVTFGSADSDSFSYDPNTGRMASYIFSVNGNADAGTLTWNANGTLGKLVIADSIPSTTDSQTCTYMYDDLGRIGGKDSNGYSVDCGTKWQQLFTYDAFGNITKTGTISFIPGYSPTQNQYTSIPSRNVSYDSNGNLLTDNFNTYTWDPNWGTVTTVNTGSAIVTATYDALGRMVENNAGGTYTEFVYGPTGAKLAYVNGTTLIKAFIALPGGATAVYNSAGLAYYRHSDWLGSSRLTSTASRTLYSSSAYAPFGEQYDTSGNTDASFTGQDQDTAVSLYDFQFRRHSPSQGRWISPDPAGLAAVSLTSPQSWNRYAYVNNMATYAADRLGLYCDLQQAAEGCGMGGWADTGSADMGTSGFGGYYTDSEGYFSGWTAPGMNGFDLQLGIGANSVAWFNPSNGEEVSPEAAAELGYMSLADGSLFSNGNFGNQCFAQLKYRAVQDPRAQWVSATHSFWYVQDSSGAQWIISAGPNNADGTSYLNVWVSGNTSTGVDNTSAGTSWDSGLSSSNCPGVQDMLEAAYSWPDNSITYNPLGPNSNSVANYLGDMGDFNPPAPPGSWGWNAPIQ